MTPSGPHARVDTRAKAPRINPFGVVRSPEVRSFHTVSAQDAQMRVEPVGGEPAADPPGPLDRVVSEDSAGRST